MSTEINRTYTPEFDQKAYKRIAAEVNGFHVKERERLDSFTEKQLQTLLSERYNVLVSGFNYEMDGDGLLWGEDMNEPAIKSFKRGRDHRKQVVDSVDHEREDAEIEGFEKIQGLLKEGKDVLSISPQGGEGSIYQHNFYDIFKWKNGKIEAKRYSSALDIQDYQRILGVDYQMDSEFLRNPIDITNTFDSAEEVHGALHIEHDYMDEIFFKDYLMVVTAPYRQGYIRALHERNEYLQRLNFNAMLNIADEINDDYGKRSDKPYRMVDVYSIEKLIDYGNRNVKNKATGCGYSGGYQSEFSILNSAPFSVKEYGEGDGECERCKKSTADNHYHCPGCNKTYADETQKSATTRTRECGCGFKFGC